MGFLYLFFRLTVVSVRFTFRHVTPPNLNLFAYNK